MKYYDYEEAMKEDIMNYIRENFTPEELKEKTPEELEDEMFTADSVTGNGSGSYTFSTVKAKQNVLAEDRHGISNIDLLREAYTGFGCLHSIGDDFISEEWEKMDVTIRCYLLPSILDDVLHEMEI